MLLIRFPRLFLEVRTFILTFLLFLFWIFPIFSLITDAFFLFILRLLCFFFTFPRHLSVYSPSFGWRRWFCVRSLNPWFSSWCYFFLVQGQDICPCIYQFLLPFHIEFPVVCFHTPLFLFRSELIDFSFNFFIHWLHTWIKPFFWISQIRQQFAFDLFPQSPWLEFKTHSLTFLIKFIKENLYPT